MKSNTGAKTVKGLWWLPDVPDRQLPGELCYGPTAGAGLNLFEYFFNGPVRDRFTVWGSTVNGAAVTLFNCNTTNMTMHLPGGRAAEIDSYFAVIGGHFRSPEEMSFAKLKVDLTNLIDWAWTTGLEISSVETGKGCTVTGRTIPSIQLGTFGDITVSLEFVSQISDEHFSYRLSEKCSLELTSPRLIAYSELTSVLHRIQHFVALGISRPVYAVSVAGQLDRPERVVEGYEIFQEFEFIHRIDVDDRASNPVSPIEMPFCLKDLQPEPSTFLAQFFEKHDRLEAVYQLYFSTLYHRNMYLPQRLLSLAHAIEGYHRAMIGGKYMDDQHYKNGLQQIFSSAIPQDIGPDFRSSLKNKLKYLHEFSLRKRIHDLCTRFTDVVQPYVGVPGEFAEELANQRNWLTHPDSTDPDRARSIDYQKLWVQCEQLSLLLEVCFMHEIGLDMQTIQKLLPRNPRTRSIRLNK